MKLVTALLNLVRGDNRAATPSLPCPVAEPPAVQHCEPEPPQPITAPSGRETGRGKGKSSRPSGSDGLTRSERRDRDKLRTQERSGQRANKAARRAEVEGGMYSC